MIAVLLRVFGRNPGLMVIVLPAVIMVALIFEKNRRIRAKDKE